MADDGLWLAWVYLFTQVWRNKCTKYKLQVASGKLFIISVVFALEFWTSQVHKIHPSVMLNYLRVHDLAQEQNLNNYLCIFKDLFFILAVSLYSWNWFFAILVTAIKNSFLHLSNTEMLVTLLCRFMLLLQLFYIYVDRRNGMNLLTIHPCKWEKTEYSY